MTDKDKKLKSRIRKCFFISLEVAAFLGVLFAIEYWQASQHNRGALHDTLKAQTFESLDGSASKLWVPQKESLIYVFAPWCGVCKKDANVLNRFVGDDVNVRALALSWESKEQLVQFSKETDLQAPILLGYDDQMEILGVESFPSYFVVNEEGTITYSWTGFTTTLGVWLRIRFAHFF